MMKFFVKDFCETVLARVVIFGMQVDNDLLHREISNQPSYAYKSFTGISPEGTIGLPSVHPSVHKIRILR